MRTQVSACDDLRLGQPWHLHLVYDRVASLQMTLIAMEINCSFSWPLSFVIPARKSYCCGSFSRTNCLTSLPASWGWEAADPGGWSC